MASTLLWDNVSTAEDQHTVRDRSIFWIGVIAVTGLTLKIPINQATFIGALIFGTLMGHVKPAGNLIKTFREKASAEKEVSSSGPKSNGTGKKSAQKLHL